MDVPYKPPLNAEFETSYAVFKASRGCLEGGSHRGRASSFGPYRMGPSPAWRTFASALCDVSMDHEPTLIERGADIRLNYPLNAHRSSHSSRPGHGLHGALHPSFLRKGDEGHNQSRGFP